MAFLTKDSENKASRYTEPLSHDPPSLERGHQVHWYAVDADHQLCHDEVDQEHVVIRPELGKC